jgi:hypothetical protein
MAFARKSKARKSPANRGRPRKSSPVPAKKTARSAPAVSAAKETQAPRKRGRSADSGRTASAHSRTDSIVAAQLETMSRGLHAIPALRDDIQHLRVRVEELAERIDELLKRPAEPNRRHPEDNQVPPTPEPESEPETPAWETEDTEVL